MDLKKFEESLELSITAAMIGISKQNWVSAKPEDSIEVVKLVMKKNSFDVLPVGGSDGTVEYYYEITDPGNYEAIQKSQISDAASIYYLTDIADLLRIFNEKSRAYYFLSNHFEIVGLVSTVNLNSKPVYVYFYNLLSKLEIELGQWIKALLPEKEILRFINKQEPRQAGKKRSNLKQDVLKRYKDDKSKNADNHIVEYLYLSQFSSLLQHSRLFSSLRYESKSKFDNVFSIIISYRNWFMHPLNSPKPALSKDLYLLQKSIHTISDRIDKSDLSLLKAYLDTNYEVRVGNRRFRLRPCKPHSSFDKFLQENDIKSWLFITAYNPDSKELSENENIDRNNELLNRINKMKYAV